MPKTQEPFYRRFPADAERDLAKRIAAGRAKARADSAGKVRTLVGPLSVVPVAPERHLEPNLGESSK